MNLGSHDDYKLPDEALLQKLCEDHAWALKDIFNRYNERLYRVAAGVLHDDALAKDLVQEVFIDLWSRRHTSNILTLSHYLLRAIKFQVLKQLRNGKLHDRHLKLIHSIPFSNSTEELINFQELENALQRSMAELPPRCREIFFLSRFENLTNKEIAVRLNISIKTVEVQMTKALSLLRRSLDREILLVIICMGMMD